MACKKHVIKELLFISSRRGNLDCFGGCKMLKTLTILMKVIIKKEGERHLHVGTQHSDKTVRFAALEKN
jgi:hypothetical protein